MTPTRPTLSILDPSPIFAGRTARDALTETRALAKAADAMGYRSFWVQEHHNAVSFAGTTPEVLMADLASRTQRITLGSGGIMLPNYSPLKVAEWGQTLNQLYPGRIEIGLGRATGADPRASAALLGPGGQSFPTMLGLLLDWLRDASGTCPLDTGHRARGIAANPPGPHPDIWMLCSSADSARFAGQMGLKLAFADFLNPGGAAPALEAYRHAFEASAFCARPYCAIGLVALAGETEADAHILASSMMAWASARPTQGFTPYLDRNAAQSVLDRLPTPPPPRGIIGSAEQVACGLMQVQADTGADEIFILSITDTLEDRIASYRRIEKALSATADAGT